MRIEHIALWTIDAERLRDFYVRWFGATTGARYDSARRAGFLSYFLTLPSGGARLELMTVPTLSAPEVTELVGYAHLALSVGTPDAVDALIATCRAGGVTIRSDARWTGDGYYEAVIEDPDGNLVELMADPAPSGG